jgi:hypothetical protein
MPNSEDLLKSIQGSLEKIHKAIEAIAEQNDTSQRDKQINAHIDSQVDVGLPVEVSEYYRSEQGERRPKNRRDIIRLILEIAGVATAIILAALTLKTFLVLRGQLREMQSQTTILQNQADQTVRDAASARTQTDEQIGIAKDQFRFDQRPVIWLSNTQDQALLFQIAQARPTSPKQILVTLHYSNYGKSPAYNMRNSRVMLVEEKSADKIKPARIPVQGGSLVPTGKDDFLTVISRPLKDEELKDIVKDDWVAVFLRFTYEDSSGNLYESDICLSHLQLGPFRECDGNDIKDCSKVYCAK